MCRAGCASGRETPSTKAPHCERRWEGAANGRLRAAYAPRFAISCSRELLEAVAELSREHRVLVHTHASESKDEVDVVRRLSGGRANLEYLADTGLATGRLCVAHCVWVNEAEQALIAERDVKVLHCPGSNLKLGSGIAPIVELRARGVCVSLGADGAACNNRLDMFDEMRLAATLQAMRRGPGALPARDVLWMATRGGALTLGLEAQIGSLERGKAGRPHRRGARWPSYATGPGPVVDARLCRAGLRRAADHGGRRDPGRPVRADPSGSSGAGRRGVGRCRRAGFQGGVELTEVVE